MEKNLETKRKAKKDFYHIKYEVRSNIWQMLFGEIIKPEKC